MKVKLNNSFASRMLFSTCAIALSCLLGSVEFAWAQPKAKATAARQKGFATSQEAANALIDAAEKFDVPALLAIVGPAGADLVETGDALQDKERAIAFAAKAREKTLVNPDPKNRARAILSVGNEEWPYPVPIVKRGRAWYFDTASGRKEILARRIGANELDEIGRAHV